jgi:Na+/melibiose symporter-like transporter
MYSLYVGSRKRQLEAFVSMLSWYDCWQSLVNFNLPFFFFFRVVINITRQSSSNCVLLSLGAMNSPPVIHPRFADWINTRSCWILNTSCRVYISILVFWINEDIFQYISLNIVYWLCISNVKVPDIYPWKMLTVIMNIKKNHPFTVTPALKGTSITNHCL